MTTETLLTKISLIDSLLMFLPNALFIGSSEFILKGEGRGKWVGLK